MTATEIIQEARAQLVRRGPLILLSGLTVLALIQAVAAGLTAADLSSIRHTAASQRSIAAESERRSLSHGATPLLVASSSTAGPTVEREVGRALAAAGLTAIELRSVGQQPFGAQLQSVHLAIKADGSPSAIAGFARWADARRTSVSLDRLSAGPGSSAAAGSVALEVTVIVRVGSQ